MNKRQNYEFHETLPQSVQLPCLMVLGAKHHSDYSRWCVNPHHSGTWTLRGQNGHWDGFGTSVHATLPRCGAFWLRTSEYEL